MKVTGKRGWIWATAGLAALAIGVATIGVAAATIGTPAAADAGAAQSSALERGRYLTRLGDCEACHTRTGGQPFAGGRAIETPYGTAYTTNITPDRQTGLGNWTEQDFRRAMHDGIRRDGAYLYPVFPFPSFTKLTAADVAAIWTYLRTVPAVHQVNTPNAFRWPYSMRSLMKVWRALYFTPGTYQPDPQRSASWNRGAYLVEGISHCGACHSPRNRLGALVSAESLAGGTVPIDGWHAPNITSNTTFGIGNWTADDVHSFLATGHSPKGDAIGPMRGVIESSLQHLSQSDIDAIVAYVRSVPARNGLGLAYMTAVPVDPDAGKQLYHDQCASCHGDDGNPTHAYYPGLRDNPVVQNLDPTDMVLQILHGGFQASTQANPYPYSMPPFGAELTDAQVAELASYVRRNFGNHAPYVWARDVSSLR